jgi:hypothetical protein
MTDNNEGKLEFLKRNLPQCQSGNQLPELWYSLVYAEGYSSE